ncbi:MAG: type II toxin-antitoxin system VapC family toxin [Planctomycetota bacterium]|nr:type II toxin-antitoxin system VapC family toxin [Planctomycetota bacterium]
MIALDTDVYGEFVRGNAAFTARILLIPDDERSITIVSAEEVLRGRLNSVRQAEAQSSKLTIQRAYALLAETINNLRGKLRILEYDDRAHDLFSNWKQQKIRVGTHDLRIAAICISHSVKLISRNRRDFEKIPLLDAEFWN